MAKKEKFFPNVGDKVTLWDLYNDARFPYTVISVSKTEVLVQECALYFAKARYFDSIADDIRENPNGRIRRLHWSPRCGEWKVAPVEKYSLIALFGKWEHEPYVS